MLLWVLNLGFAATGVATVEVPKTAYEFRVKPLRTEFKVKPLKTEFKVLKR